jgi:hypothetical protein
MEVFARLTFAIFQQDSPLISGPSTNLSALGKHVLGNQSNGQCDQSRNNDQIIQMSQDGDKIRN